MPRLFLSHSSKDNVGALSFQRWLIAQGWSKDDIFIDLHGIGAGERWRDTLRKANAACEAVLLLASPESLDSLECQREINLAEDLGKEVIVAILRDLTPKDPRLARWSDRQFVDLSANPSAQMETIEYEGQLHRVHFHVPALRSIATRLALLGIAPGSFTWEPKKLTDGTLEGPYPGLAAFGEEHAGIFFGRETDIMVGLTRLRRMRKQRTTRLLIIQAASGAGKSSFLRAGLWPRLKRDPDFVPLAIVRPALGLVTGPDGLGRRIAPFFARYGQTRVPGDISGSLIRTEYEEGAMAFASLISDATALAANVRRAANPDACAPAAIIAIDQGEELFAPETAAESDRFLELLAAVLKSPPGETDPYVLVTIRSDCVEPLLQRWPSLGLDAPETQVLPPLSPSRYGDVILKPAEIYSSCVKKLELEPALADQLAHDARGADAMPLLAFTMERLFHEFGADGKLTVDRYLAAGGVGGSIDRALTQAVAQAGAHSNIEDLKRLIVPWLATWDPTANAAKRLPANESELLSGNGAARAGLVNALVEGRLLTRGAGTLEVAHEALLRRPLIDGWLELHKDGLKLRDDILKEARDWADCGKHVEGIVRRGARLEAAIALQANSDFTTALASAKDYLAACRNQESVSQRRVRRGRAAITTLLLGTIAGLLGVIYKEPIAELWFEHTTLRQFIATDVKPFALSDERVMALEPGNTFQDCAKNCPKMVMVPGGAFQMGSPESEIDRFSNEGPVRTVAVSGPFAVGKFEVTWDEWNQCVAMHGCDGRPTEDANMGRANRPVINVSWKQAKTYAAWLSRITGHEYRLLTEAEWEYAARSGSQTVFSFGDDPTSICKYANSADRSYKKAGYAADAADCDDRYHTTSPVGSYLGNAFGLHDMHGNVWEWVEDCFGSYEGAPTDGSKAAERPDCPRVVRSGSWNSKLAYVRSASRYRYARDNRLSYVGFRVTRVIVLRRPK